ncbi:hypothetical protein [Actinoalloteichus spitiensis]|uniref:hypothetical protein n=1 Tax=Actinoalloteichus spitiensis TaxID=252394 RepID=UPI000475385F|nr:hypothetical protein [Actinoalloteichus spitiensis]
MAARRQHGPSTVATLINLVGFALAAILVGHIVFTLFGWGENQELVSTVADAADFLSLFFPGLVDAGNPTLQLLADYGLAAAFWVLVMGVAAKIFG